MDQYDEHHHYRLMVPLSKGQQALVKHLEAELWKDEERQRRPHISKEEHAMLARCIVMQQTRIDNIKYGESKGEEDPFGFFFSDKKKYKKRL